MNPGLDHAPHIFADRKKLDVVSELPRKFDVQRSYPGNPFNIDILKIDFHAVGNGGEDGEFVGRINAFHIESRVCLCIPVRLGF